MSRRALAWTLCGLAIAVGLAAAILVVVEPRAYGPAGAGSPGPEDQLAEISFAVTFFEALVTAAFAVLGGSVAARRPRNPIGWLFIVVALSQGVGALLNSLYWLLAFGESSPPPVSDAIAAVVSVLWIPWVAALASVIPQLFPTGLPLTPRWRWLLRTSVTAAVVMIVSGLLTPGPVRSGDFAWVDNPFGVDGLALATVAEVAGAVLVATAVLAVVSLVLRFRRSNGIERLQLRWLAAATCVLFASIVGSSLVGEGIGWLALLIGQLALILAIGIALLRYRLYDIDVVINRALVYGTLTATLAGAYLGAVLLLQLVLGGVTGDSGLAVAASTLTVAALFRPARARIQELVDRRFYRRKYDAQRTLTAFTAGLRDEVGLDAITAELRAVVADTMQPSQVWLWLPERRG